MILERILVLAYTPADCNQITDWAPFRGDTLAEIVNQHNKKLKKVWENNGYSPSDIDQYMEMIDVVRHDLNRIDKLVDADYDSILILLADLDVDIFQRNLNELIWVRNGLSKTKKRVKYYLTQTGQKNDAKKLIDFFRGRTLPYPKRPPNVLNSQEDFENFIWYLFSPPDPVPNTGGLNTGGGGVSSGGGGGGASGGGFLGKVDVENGDIDELFPPQFGRDRGGIGLEEKKKEYLSARAKIKSDVREVAIENDLTEEEMRAVARLATQQELALSDISRMVSEPSLDQIILDTISTPVVHLAYEPFQKPRYERVELLQFRPNRAMEDMSIAQRRRLHRLGIMNENCAVVNLNTPENQNQLKGLGNSISVRTISADLPFFRSDPNTSDVQNSSLPYTNTKGT